MDIVNLIAVPFVSAVVGAVAAIIVNHVDKGARDSIDAQKAMAQGIKTLLRNELVAAHREWVEEKGFIKLESLEYVEDTYKCYHALKGNGSGTKLWEDIKALPVKR